MSALLSKPSQHAIQALVYLGRLRASDSATVHTIASETGISEPFLAKTVRRLVEAGILESFRGPGGGIRLARPPHRITVLEVVSILDPEGGVESCVLGFAECGGANPCPMHERWAVVRGQIQRCLDATTIADLSDTMDHRDEP